MWALSASVLFAAGEAFGFPGSRDWGGVESSLLSDVAIRANSVGCGGYGSRCWTERSRETLCNGVMG